MSRSWSSAHDWKSCKGQKLFESSNLSISAKNKSLPSGRFLFLSAGWRDSNQNRTPRWGVHLPVRTLANTSVFPLEKRKRIFSISAKKNSPPSGGLFFFNAGWRDSNQNRTSQRDVHRPVRTLRWFARWVYLLLRITQTDNRLTTRDFSSQINTSRLPCCSDCCFPLV